MRLILVLLSVTVLFSCSTQHDLKQGSWRGIVAIQGQELPMNFTVKKEGEKYMAVLRNDEEEILLDEIFVKGDSVIMNMHIFDSEIHAKMEGEKLVGYFVKNYEKDFKLPFKATFGEEYRFVKSEDIQTEDFSGKYAVNFDHEGDTTIAVGIFHQNGNELTGTFLTPIGDYRYLQGNVVDGEMMLSAFDGNHAFVFRARKTEDGLLEGDYWSGKDWHETWTGVKDDNASLPDAESLTFLKEGYDKIEFSFPDIDGKMISSSDERFKGKVVILQIFGTWCPNCMDETKFLSQWYPRNKDRGVEILGLAYEAKDDFDYASGRVKKMKEKMDVPYDFVIAGNKDKEEAAKTLPMLNHVLSFPTTIFIGKDGTVKRIHTGFSGPGTGIYYERFIQRFNQTVQELLDDKSASIK
ncbi:MAG TPA: TlpA disulfide reductase family protein [Cyclobacteriaceae bacterium]|nr:TlpA disulfide reductase family protein [Cyclobacteriaceae bacterium]